uniref:Uncharacterized protein n=1 Tax=Aegilops tauschii subsp. strangulata TaxID=200361 RepID=A0A453NUM2_AEGTS
MWQHGVHWSTHSTSLQISSTTATIRNGGGVACTDRSMQRHHRLVDNGCCVSCVRCFTLYIKNSSIYRLKDYLYMY